MLEKIASIHGRLILPEDQSWIRQLLADPILVEHLPFGAHTLEEADERFARYLKISADGPPPFGIYVYLHPQTHEQVSYGILRAFESGEHVGVEYGLAVDPKFWRRGVGTLTINALISNAKAAFPGISVYGVITKNNLPSQLLAQFCGFKRVSTMMSDVELDIWKLLP